MTERPDLPATGSPSCDGEPASSTPAAVRRSALTASACSVSWDSSPAVVWGTAAVARFFVALEQPGPWGQSALLQSRLDPRVGAALESGCAQAGGRALIIRAPGRRGVADPGAGPMLYVSGGMGHGRPWLLGGRIHDPGVVTALPFEAAAAGDLDAVRSILPELVPLTEAVLLVCAHSKRDVCCAVRGRPVAAAAATTCPGRVWECSHTGGHRFAATAVRLPDGATVARLDDDLARVSLRSSPTQLPGSLLGPRHLRGLAHLDPVHQAADGFVRDLGAVTDVTALQCSDSGRDERGQVVTVRHRDGRSWKVLVRVVADPVARTGSCGTAALPTSSFAVHELD